MLRMNNYWTWSSYLRKSAKKKKSWWRGKSNKPLVVGRVAEGRSILLPNKGTFTDCSKVMIEIPYKVNVIPQLVVLCLNFRQLQGNYSKGHSRIWKQHLSTICREDQWGLVYSICSRKRVSTRQVVSTFSTSEKGLYRERAGGEKAEVFFTGVYLRL